MSSWIDLRSSAFSCSSFIASRWSIAVESDARAKDCIAVRESRSLT